MVCGCTSRMGRRRGLKRCRRTLSACSFRIVTSEGPRTDTNTRVFPCAYLCAIVRDETGEDLDRKARKEKRYGLMSTDRIHKNLRRSESSSSNSRRQQQQNKEAVVHARRVCRTNPNMTAVARHTNLKAAWSCELHCTRNCLLAHRVEPSARATTPTSASEGRSCVAERWSARPVSAAADIVFPTRVVVTSGGLLSTSSQQALLIRVLRVRLTLLTTSRRVV